MNDIALLASYRKLACLPSHLDLLGKKGDHTDCIIAVVLKAER